MALVNFYQLAILYNLSCDNAGILPNHSHPPSMPATTLSCSRSPPVGSGQPGSKTPERTRDAARSVPDPTPLAVGSSVLQRLQFYPDKARKYDVDKYEQYIVQDFERHRVFVDIDVFMEYVLHVPKNWKKLWGRTIRSIKRNSVFSTAHWDYTRQCGTQGVNEVQFYQPLVDMGNAILEFSNLGPSDSVKPQTPQRYLRNDPRKVLCGLMNNLKPDIIAVHEDFLPHIRSKENEDARLKESNVTWAQPLQVLEVKPWDNALVDGSCMPRLKVKGKLATPSRNVDSMANGE